MKEKPPLSREAQAVGTIVATIFSILMVWLLPKALADAPLWFLLSGCAVIFIACSLTLLLAGKNTAGR